ncbi:MAG: hypothetical protein JW983_10275 [Elusimicrobia bacterium]|nr:hypothetical protein [Elusimicrobiota bacterium]
MNRYFFLFILLIIPPTLLLAGDKPLWLWYEPYTEIYSPSFSMAGDELVVVRKKHIPDFAEAEMFSETQLAEYYAPIEKDERYADPEIVILKIGTNTISRVDWGWSPVFSSDGRQIAYEHQKNPISRFRVLAKTLAGNDIRIFNRNNKITTILATPDSGHLSDPLFSSDGKYVVYSLGDAINGDFAGNVGIGRVSIDDKSSEILYPPTKEFGLYHIIDPKHFISNHLIALRSKPTSGGTFLAKSYKYELLDIGPPTKSIYTYYRYENQQIKRVIYAWSLLSFGPTGSGGLLIYDGGWHSAGQEIQSCRTSSAEVPGILSPNGSMTAVIVPKGIDIRYTQNQHTLKTIKIKGRIQNITWSSDSRRIAVVVTKYQDYEMEIFSRDELSVFEL